MPLPSISYRETFNNRTTEKIHMDITFLACLRLFYRYGWSLGRQTITKKYIKMNLTNPPFNVSYQVFCYRVKIKWMKLYRVKPAEACISDCFTVFAAFKRHIVYIPGIIYIICLPKAYALQTCLFAQIN